MTQNILKTIRTLSCWYSLESSRWVLSDEYPFARVSVISVFLHHFELVKLATSSISVKQYIPHFFIPSSIERKQRKAYLMVSFIKKIPQGKSTENQIRLFQHKKENGKDKKVKKARMMWCYLSRRFRKVVPEDTSDIRHHGLLPTCNNCIQIPPDSIRKQ